VVVGIWICSFASVVLRVVMKRWLPVKVAARGAKVRASARTSSCHCEQASGVAKQSTSSFVGSGVGVSSFVWFASSEQGNPSSSSQ
jgi:hypothetical protein